MAWRESKDAGKRAFSEGGYSEALSFYSDAIDQLLAESSSSSDDNAPRAHRGRNPSEHQILLSNVVACRLKIGGQDMSERAVDDAKKCVSLNKQWSKAHVRLASAYIALGGHSNDACLSLQRAMSLDRNNKVAREMLVKEMRHRNNRERNGGSGSADGEAIRGGRNGSPPSSHNVDNSDYHPTEETPRHSFPEPSAPPHPSQSTHENDGSNDGIDVDDIEPPDAYRSLTLSQRIQHHFAQFTSWFYSQSEDTQTLVKVACFFLVLYVALGGRFGLNYALGGDEGGGRRGNYRRGNAYDRYYSTSTSSARNRYSDGGKYGDGYKNSQDSSTYRSQRNEAGTHARQTSSGYNDRSNPQNDKYYSRYENEQYHEPRSRQGSSSYHMPNLYDGSLASMAILLVIGFVCHRFGINPFQVMWMLNLMQRRGGRHRMGGYGYGAYGRGGMGGGGFGFGRGRFGQRRGGAGYY